MCSSSLQPELDEHTLLISSRKKKKKNKYMENSIHLLFSVFSSIKCNQSQFQNDVGQSHNASLTLK